MSFAFFTFSFGSFALFACLWLNLVFPLPFAAVRASYAIPVSIILGSIYSGFHDTGETLWNNVAFGRGKRLVLLGFYFLLLSPFWFWWQGNRESIYLFLSVLLFLFFYGVLLCSMISMVRIRFHETGATFLFVFSTISRLGLIYFSLGPILAYLIVGLCLSRHCSGLDILLHFSSLAAWQKGLAVAPVASSLLAMFLCSFHCSGSKTEVP